MMIKEVVVGLGVAVGTLILVLALPVFFGWLILKLPKRVLRKLKIVEDDPILLGLNLMIGALMLSLLIVAAYGLGSEILR